jgi:hypothetical protein
MSNVKIVERTYVFFKLAERKDERKDDIYLWYNGMILGTSSYLPKNDNVGTHRAKWGDWEEPLSMTLTRIQLPKRQRIFIIPPA